MVINIKSGQKSKIECRCKQRIGHFEIFVGCQWKLVESNCSSVLFTLAEDSAGFHHSFGNQTFTGDTEIETTDSITTLAAELEVLMQQLEELKEQLNSESPIKTIKGMVTDY